MIKKKNSSAAETFQFLNKQNVMIILHKMEAEKKTISTEHIDNRNERMNTKPGIYSIK